MNLFLVLQIITLKIGVIIKADTKLKQICEPLTSTSLGPTKNKSQ